MTVEEFFAWNPQDGRLWQLVDGDPQMMAPPNRTHGAIQSELGRLLGNHLAEHRPACSVITTPGVIPRVNADHNIRVPDLGVSCSDYRTEQAALADPVLLIEILSPGNQPKTWTNIWAYTTIPSVQELLGSADGDNRRRPAAPAPRRNLAGAANRHRGRRSGAGQRRFPGSARCALPHNTAGAALADGGMGRAA